MLKVVIWYRMQRVGADAQTNYGKARNLMRSSLMLSLLVTVGQA